MEGLQTAFQKFSEDVKSMASSFELPSLSSPPPPPPLIPSRVLITRPPRNLVSVWTCSKLCAVCFVAGVFVGYTLKRRVRRWVSGLLKKLKD
ncbi:uncharacterized protein LOC141605806 [Silene latifolia]|uniref:uncharacterized protein LOC141605806 n=1 Tax=Silene latifolia TaxID=37657 RepID=UPI003D776450